MNKMKAHEARKLAKQADEATKVSEDAHYERIMDKIREQLSKDECYDIWWYCPISKRLQNRLIADGYAVKNNSNQKDGVMYVISWAE